VLPGRRRRSRAWDGPRLAVSEPNSALAGFVQLGQAKGGDPWPNPSTGRRRRAPPFAWPRRRRFPPWALTVWPRHLPGHEHRRKLHVAWRRRRAPQRGFCRVRSRGCSAQNPRNGEHSGLRHIGRLPLSPGSPWPRSSYFPGPRAPYNPSLESGPSEAGHSCAAQASRRLHYPARRKGALPLRARSARTLGRTQQP
jgi:hypothetical protein